MRLRGCVEIAINDAKGERLSYRKVDNLIVDMGRQFIGRKIQSNSPPADVVSYLGVGASGSAPSGSQTDLVSPVYRKTIGTIITTSLVGATPYFQAIASFTTDEANSVIAEAGLFTAPTGGFMLGRTTFSGTTKTTAQSMTMTYTVSF